VLKVIGELMDWRRLFTSCWMVGIIGFFVGSSVIWVPMLSGKSIGSAVFDFAYAVIGLTVLLRSLVGWLAFAGILLIGGTGYAGFRLRGHAKAQLFLQSTGFVLGLTVALSIVYFLLDLGFFVGAILTMPFILGAMMLAATAGHTAAHPVLGQSQRAEIGRAEIPSIAGLSITALLSLLLLLPNLTAIAGLEPTPPLSPTTGYGSVDAAYDVTHFSQSIVYPENVTGWFDEAADAYDWKVHIYAPKNYDRDSIGVAILLHGYTGEDATLYEDSMQTLASQGLIGIFVQYVSDVNLSSIPTDFELQYDEGGSNHPQHVPRYTMALFGVDAALNFAVTDASIQATIGAAQIDMDHLWIGGHSMGAGTTFYVLSEGLSRGWGISSLVVDLEQPWIHAVQPEFRGNMTSLPDHTLIQIVESDNDLAVAECIGRWQHARLLGRDNSTPLPANQVRFVALTSDYHGFPRLIATHYLPVTFLRDTFADRAYYSRLAAESDYVASMSQSETAAAELARAAFMEPAGSALDMGSWSDGTPVHPIRFIDEPLDDSSIDWSRCQLT
jgi:hypothetical protein